MQIQMDGNGNGTRQAFVSCCLVNSCDVTLCVMICGRRTIYIEACVDEIAAANYSYSYYYLYIVYLISHLNMD